MRGIRIGLIPPNASPSSILSVSWGVNPSSVRNPRLVYQSRCHSSKALGNGSLLTIFPECATARYILFPDKRTCIQIDRQNRGRSWGSGLGSRFILWESSVPAILRQGRGSDQDHLSLPPQVPDAPGEAMKLQSRDQNLILNEQLLGWPEAK
jgi:hypothetical protein